MATPITTEQEVKTIVTPGSDPDTNQWTRYTEKYTWSLDPITLVPIGVQVERTPI
jgi:hypothetical protein